MTDTVVAIIEPAISHDEAHIKILWNRFCDADAQRTKRGLEFGRGMYEYREKYSSQGRRTDLTSYHSVQSFSDLLKKLEIPRQTAYNWIARYEESIGIRQGAPIINTAQDITTGDDAGGGEVDGPKPLPNKRTAMRANAHKERMVQGLSMIFTASDVMTKAIDPQLIGLVCDCSELEVWIDRARKSRIAVRQFMTSLEAVLEAKRTN